MLQIQPARPEDIDELVTLLKILFSIEEDFQFDEKRQRQGLRMMLASKISCVLVAKQNGQVVGMCTGQVVISTAEGGPALLVEDVVVREEYRGLGIGKDLMKSLAQWSISKGIKRMQLLADKKNQQALNFYKHVGWQTTQLVCLRKLNL